MKDEFLRYEKIITECEINDLELVLNVFDYQVVTLLFLYKSFSERNLLERKNKVGIKIKENVRLSVETYGSIYDYKALQHILHEDITIEQLCQGMPDPDWESMLMLCIMEESYLLQLSSHVLCVFIESATTLHTLYRDTPDSEFWKCLTGHPLKVEYLLCYQHFRNSKLLPSFKYIQLIILYSGILLKEDESRFIQYIQDNRTCFLQIVRKITDKDKLDLYLDILMYFLNFPTSTNEARETVCELFCESVMTILTVYGNNKVCKIFYSAKISETSVTSTIISLLLEASLLLKDRQTQLVQYLLTTSDKKRWSSHSNRTVLPKPGTFYNKETANMFLEYISNHYRQLLKNGKHDNLSFDKLFKDFYRHVKETKTNWKYLEMLVLVMILLLTLTPGGQHKSAKLKKYLALKYEYKDIILYILRSSGDIESNPGPRQKKSLLCYYSQRVREWIQSMSPIILKLYWGYEPNSKPKHLWNQKPDHWPSSQPFYDTKNKSKDQNGNSISDEDLLRNLLDCCKQKNIDIPNLYQTEIAAWRKKRTQLLFTLHAIRTMTEILKVAIQNLYPYKDSPELKQMLEDLSIPLEYEDKVCDKNKRLKGQSEMVADITRYLASTLCKIVKQLDPEKKCDRIWNEPPEGWPENVPFFNPHNRGKYIKTCSDHDFFATLLQHPKAIIPSNYRNLVQAYQDMRNAITDMDKKTHMEDLCKRFSIQTNVSDLVYALQHLQKERFFTSEVHSLLNQWWTTETANEADVEKLSPTTNTRQSAERPNILITVDKDFIILVTALSDLESHSDTLISYCKPISDYSTPTTSTISLSDNDSQTQQCTTILHKLPSSNLESYTDASSISLNIQTNDEHSKPKQTNMISSQSKDTNEENENCINLQEDPSLQLINVESQPITCIKQYTILNNRAILPLKITQSKAKKRKTTYDMPEPSNVKKPCIASLQTQNTCTETIEQKPATDSNNTKPLDLDEFSTITDYFGLSLPKNGILCCDMKSGSDVYNQSPPDRDNFDLEIFLNDMINFESGEKSELDQLLLEEENSNSEK